jgi:cytochrome c
MVINVCFPKAIGGLAVTALIALVIVLVLSRLSSADDSSGASGFSPYVTKEGGISLPPDYREKFPHMGTWAVAKKADTPVFEMHNVYAPLKDIEAYRRDGKFPDGAVLVKEITNASSDKLTTGESAWATNIKVWFVMVKDAKGRFPGNDLWGDGWGWALFEAKDPKRNVATDYKTDCKICHIPAKNDDWLYVRGYSILAKPTSAK